MTFNPFITIREENRHRNRVFRDPAELIAVQNNPQTANPAPVEPVANPQVGIAMHLVSLANARSGGVAPGPITTHDMSVAIQVIQGAERYLLNLEGGDVARIQGAAEVMIRRIANGNRQGVQWEGMIRSLSELNQGDRVRPWIFNNNDNGLNDVGLANIGLSNALEGVLTIYNQQNWE